MKYFTALLRSRAGYHREIELLIKRTKNGNIYKYKALIQDSSRFNDIKNKPVHLSTADDWSNATKTILDREYSDFFEISFVRETKFWNDGVPLFDIERDCRTDAIKDLKEAYKFDFQEAGEAANYNDYYIEKYTEVENTVYIGESQYFKMTMGKRGGVKAERTRAI